MALDIDETREGEAHLQPLDEIHSRVKGLFALLTVLSIVILITMGFQVFGRDRLHAQDFAWMAMFALATISLTFAEIGCLRYIRERVRPQMVSLVLRDELTGMFNRRYICDRIDEEIARAKRYNRPFALIYFDLDRFKEVNDRLGHDEGDFILKQAGNSLAQFLRREDIIARMGGDEFLALLPETTATDAANLVIRLHTQFLADKLQASDGQVLDFVAFSAGVSCFPDDGKTREDLLSVADRNMYDHKSSKEKS